MKKKITFEELTPTMLAEEQDRGDSEYAAVFWERVGGLCDDATRLSDWAIKDKAPTIMIAALKAHKKLTLEVDKVFVGTKEMELMTLASFLSDLNYMYNIYLGRPMEYIPAAAPNRERNLPW